MAPKNKVKVGACLPRHLGVPTGGWRGSLRIDKPNIEAEFLSLLEHTDTKEPSAGPLEKGVPGCGGQHQRSLTYSDGCDPLQAASAAALKGIQTNKWDA